MRTVHLPHVLAVNPQPLRVPVAQFPLFQLPALIVSIADERGRAKLTLVHRAACGVAAGEQLDLGEHGLFFLQAQVVGRDALGPRIGSVSIAFLPGRERSNCYPSG